jgi:succinate dehydrogenase/fumarate reductase flavoprotein subunit
MTEGSLRDSAQDACDVIVVGAGAAGMAAACTAAALGLRVMLVEHSDRIGGTTAISGGMTWIPANHKMREVGIDDDLDQARTYLRATVPSATDDPRLRGARGRGTALP